MIVSCTNSNKKNDITPKNIEQTTEKPTEYTSEYTEEQYIKENNEKANDNDTSISDKNDTVAQTDNFELIKLDDVPEYSDKPYVCCREAALLKGSVRDRHRPGVSAWR